MQKKILTTIVVFIISIFISLTSVNAATKLVFSENSNGNIKTSLHFEDGFVGGFDITLKVNGNVKFKEVSLDSSIKKDNYTTNTSYDEKNKTIHVVVTTGGVGTSHNLLNVNKELVLGNILFEAASNNDVTYTIECNSLTTLDNTWRSQKITPEFDANKQFTYKVTTQAEDKKDDNDSSKNNESSGNNETNNNGSHNSGSSSNGSSNNSSSNNSGNNQGGTNNNTDDDDDVNSSDDNKDDEDEEDTDSDNTDDDNNNDTDDTKKDTDKKDNKDSEDKEDADSKSKGSKIGFIVAGIAILVVIAGVYFIVIKKKN